MKHYRTIFISDCHLGSTESKDKALLEFLKNHSSETLYLVGDILDCWSIGSSWHWTDTKSEILQIFWSWPGDIIYIPGNHDAIFRALDGVTINKVAFRNRAIFRGLNDKQFLVIHGDEVDKLYDWMSRLFYRLDRIFIRVFGVSAWTWFKHLQFLHYYPQLFASRIIVLKGSLDGVICGHIHHPESKQIDGAHYYNTGDWTNSCTALAEDYDGNLIHINRT